MRSVDFRVTAELGEFHEMFHDGGSFVEGIGDDMIIGLLVSVIIIIPVAGIMYRWFVRSNAPQVIHPESQATVQTARDRLRDQNRMPPGQGSQSARPTDRETTCPICIANASHAVETNCSHIFCGMCMITYWQHGSWMGAVRCPVCRQTVSIMLFDFTEDEMRTESDEKTEVMSNINTYNRRFSGEPREWVDYIRDLPMLLRHCLSEFFSVGGLIMMFRLRVVICFIVALLYFISPLDLIPEAVFGILGFLDDFFVLMLLTIYVSIIYRRLVTARAHAEG